MRIDFIRSDAAVILNSWIDVYKDGSPEEYKGDYFLDDVDWNLQNGGNKFNSFIDYLIDKGIPLTNIHDLNSQSDWNAEQLWIRCLPNFPQVVLDKFGLEYNKGTESQPWYSKTTGMIICSDKLIECNEELITCL